MQKLGLLGGMLVFATLLSGCGATSLTEPVTSNADINSNAVVTNNSGQTAAPTTFTMDDVAKHNVKEDCYTVVNGSVYNLTTAISSHPGGPLAVIGLCGKDGTEKFINKHGGQDGPEANMAKLKIGELVN